MLPVDAIKQAKDLAEGQVAQILRDLEDSTGARVEVVIVHHGGRDPGLRTVKINLSI